MGFVDFQPIDAPLYRYRRKPWSYSPWYLIHNLLLDYAAYSGVIINFALYPGVEYITDLEMRVAAELPFPLWGYLGAPIGYPEQSREP